MAYTQFLHHLKRLELIHHFALDCHQIFTWSTTINLLQKCRNCWRGDNELYSLYLLHHINGHMHVCLITSYLLRLFPSEFLLCTNSSQQGWLYIETYMCILGLRLPIQLLLKLLSSEYDHRLVNHRLVNCFYHVLIMLEQIDLPIHVILPVIY